VDPKLSEFVGDARLVLAAKLHVREIEGVALDSSLVAIARH